MQYDGNEAQNTKEANLYEQKLAMREATNENFEREAQT